MLSAWQAAVDVATRLARRRATRAVAVTGSLARGAYGDGSDVDLWVLGDACRHREITVDGVVVSLLETDAAYEASASLLLRFEVGLAVPLFDPRAALAHLQDRARAEAAVVAAAHGDVSREALSFLLRRARRGPRSMAVAALREWSRRTAALRVLVERGLRVPRWRDFEATLARGAARTLEQAVHLPTTTGLVAALSAARRAGDVVPELPLPRLALVRRYLDAGRDFDAVVAVRQGLPPAPRCAPLSPAHQRLFTLAHGHDERVTADTIARQAELAAAVAAAVDARGLGVIDDPRAFLPGGARGAARRG